VERSQIKIAILLSGLLRHWDYTSTMFYYLQEKFSDIQLDFYLSTWEDNETVHTKVDKGFHQPFKNKHPNFILKDYCINKFSDVGDLSTNVNPQVFYSFAKQKLSELFSKKNIDYDCIVFTRCDSFIFKELIESIVDDLMEQKITGYNLKNKKIIYSDTGTRVKDNLNLFCDKDTLFFGNEDLVNLYSDLFDYGKNYQYDIHILEANFLNDKKVYNGRHNIGSTHELVRNQINPNKLGMPHRTSLIELDNIYGKDIYNFTREELKNLFDKHK
jgi:hypothetical protein